MDKLATAMSHNADSEYPWSLTLADLKILDISETNQRQVITEYCIPLRPGPLFIDCDQGDIACLYSWTDQAACLITISINVTEYFSFFTSIEIPS